MCVRRAHHTYTKCRRPSGTLSLLGGVTAGCHPAFAKYYLKRMRMTRDWGDDAKLRGYHVEPVEWVSCAASRHN